jgi:hypothetical protein
MVCPLVALFLGTGNQIVKRPYAILERLLTISYVSCSVRCDGEEKVQKQSVLLLTILASTGKTRLISIIVRGSTGSTNF